MSRRPRPALRDTYRSRRKQFCRSMRLGQRETPLGVDRDKRTERKSSVRRWAVSEGTVA